MTLFTSSLRLSGRSPNAVAISNGTRPYRVRKYPPLIPPWPLVRDSKAGQIDRATFDAAYLRQLSKLDARQVFKDLEAFGPEIILCCWETAGEYCHRRTAARWLETELGIAVPELRDLVTPR